MSKRVYNLVRPREDKQGRTRWDRHGVLIIETDRGTGEERITVRLDSIPAHSWDGWLRGFAAGRRDGTGDRQAAPAGDFGDDVPF